MKRGTLCSVCGLALFIFGCPKRQPTRVVYVPSSPVSTSTAATPEILVIEEPAPPEPELPAPAEPPMTEPTPARRPRRTAPPPITETPEIEPEEPPLAEVPALEPRESPAQQAALRQQILQLQQGLLQRMGRLENLRLGARSQRGLADARTFLTQSQQALEKGDLQRALNLAQKAELLVSDLEQGR